jgi:hypothetical protein
LLVIQKYQGAVHTITKLRHGKGTYAYDNAFFTYEGTYEDGKKNGEGALKFRDGRVIHGNFVEDELVGHAEIDYPDGAKYIGNLNFGEREGEGTFSSLF